MSNVILVVEDQDDNRRILRDLLLHSGYQVIEALNGIEGVSAAETHRPDLILMDIQLPGIDGYEATRRIKANSELKNIPIIVHSFGRRVQSYNDNLPKIPLKNCAKQSVSFGQLLWDIR